MVRVNSFIALIAWTTSLVVFQAVMFREATGFISMLHWMSAYMIIAIIVSGPACAAMARVVGRRSFSYHAHYRRITYVIMQGGWKLVLLGIPVVALLFTATTP